MVDREARNQLAALIEAYMDERIDNMEFDDALFKIDTKDRLVQQAPFQLWYFYDDLITHNIGASKEDWAYFNRYLLLLNSDAELEEVDGPKKWTIRQPMAALCLAFAVTCAFMLGFGIQLLLPIASCGIALLVIAKAESRMNRKREFLYGVIAPFDSVSSLLNVRRRTPYFVKRRYPPALKRRRLRDPVTFTIMSIQGYLLMALVAPIFLALMVLPESTNATRIRLEA